jgi:hypothetical protein
VHPYLFVVADLFPVQGKMQCVVFEFCHIFNEGPAEGKIPWWTKHKSPEVLCRRKDQTYPVSDDQVEAVRTCFMCSTRKLISEFAYQLELKAVFRSTEEMR